MEERAVAAALRPGPSAKSVGAPFAWLGQAGVTGRRIGGRVVHAGQPVPHATVRLTTEQLRVGEWILARVETDGAGRFAFGVRPAIKYRVVAGTVRDAAGGVIVGAHVRAGSEAQEFGATLSDQQGAYRLCVSAGPLHIEAGADGYGTIVKHVVARREARVDFALALEVAIAGRVVAGDGTPVAGAVVVAATNGHDPGAVAESAADGQFRLTGLVAGTYLLIARADDRACQQAVDLTGGNAADDLVLTLAAGAPLAGRVTAGGRPVSGATVTARNADAAWKLGSAVSQADGRFLIGGLPADTIKIGVDGHKLISPDETVDLALVREVEFQCERLAKVSGRVVREGKPVARAEVALYQEPGRPRRVATHDDGTFALEGVTPGSYELYAETLAKDAFMARRPIAIGARDIEGLVLELDLSASIAGVVVDAAGAPVAGVNVHFYRDRDWGSDITAADGTFLVPGLAGGGEYQVNVIQAPDAYFGYRPPKGHRFPVVHVPDGTSRVSGVRITIVRADLSISGRVVRGNEPVGGVDIGAQSRGAMGHAQSGPDGTFVIGELVPGRYQLNVERRGGYSSVRVEAEAGARDVRIELPPGGAIAGTLRGFRGVPTVTASAETGMYRGDVKDTRFSFSDVPVGTYELHAVGPNGAHGSASATVRADKVAQVTIEASATAQVTGLVKDWRTGAPIAGAYCSWNGERGGYTHRPTRADAAGRFTMGVPAGRVQIQCNPASAHGVSARHVMVDLAPGASVQVEMDLIVSRREGRFSPPGVLLAGRAPAPIVRLGAVAATSGLRLGDVVREVDGQSVAEIDPYAVSFLISDHDPEAPAKVTVVRDDAELAFHVSPEAPPSEDE